jgi:hypothetical protein
MTDPVTAAVAAAVAGKLAESLTDGAKKTVAAIAHQIRQKFRHQPAALAALEAAHDDPARLGDLEVLLAEAMTRDPEFGRQIQTLWQQTGIQPQRGDVMNVFNGNAKKVIQARDVGTINLH